MSELLIGFLLLVAAPALIAIGMLLGRLLFGRNESHPTRLSDAATTSRTIQRLANDGAIDEETRAKLVNVLRESYAQGLDVPAPPLRTVEPPHAELVQDGSVPLRTTEAHEPPESVNDDAEVPIEAEIVEEAPSPPVVHPLDAPEPVAELGPTRPQQHRRAFADVLYAFMQDKNIRWGELVSGLLIVGCSIALVISLRSEIESLSERFIYLPALLFMLATAAIHAAGNYTLRQWNLQATSRGVLIIATLLIPINFLAAIIVTGPESQQLPPFHPLYLSAVAVGILAFGTMAYFASQALMREGSWRLWVGVMGTSAGQLLINRLADRGATAITASLLVSLPLIAYLVAMIAQLRVASRRPRIGMTLATETLLLLGITSFALASSVGLLLSKSDSVRTALAWLSTPLSLPAVVILATGLALHRRLLSRRLTTLKTVGTSLTMTGGVMMLVAVLLAWPEPQLLIAVGVFTFTSLTLLAGVGRLPALHVPAIACGSLALLVAFHAAQSSFVGYEGNLSRRMYELFFLGRSGVILTVIAVVIAGAAAVLLRQGRRASAFSYLVGCATIAGLSVLLAVSVGFFGAEAQESNLASPVLLFYAVALFVASYFVPTTALTWTGSTLLLISFVHMGGWNTAVEGWLTTASLSPTRPVLLATILHGLVAATIACVLAKRKASPSIDEPALRWRQLVTPLTQSALLSSALALPWSALVFDQQFGEHAWYMAALSLIFLAATVIQRSSLNFSIFQTLATVAVIFTTTSICQRQSWWSEQLLSPQHLQSQFGSLAVWCLAWSAGRRLIRRRWPGVARLMRSNEQTVDEFVLAATVVAMIVMCVIGCASGAAVELGIGAATNFESSQSWQLVFGTSSWVASALLLAAAIGSLVERFSLQAFCTLFLIAATGASLAGGRAYESIAVASGLRWSFASIGVLLTIAVCMSLRIEATIRRLAWLEWDELPKHLNRVARCWTIGISAIPILGLTTASLVQAATGVAPSGPTADSFFTRIGSELSYGVPLALLSAMLIAHAVREKKTTLMLAASGVFQYLVNLAYLLPILKDPGAKLDWSVVIGCLQWNALGLAVFALAWLSVRPWLDTRHRVTSPGATLPDTFDRCLVIQVVAALVAVTATTGLATAVVVASPQNLTRFGDLGSWLSYLVCVLGFGAATWLTRSRQERFGISLLLGFLFAIGGPVAVSLEGRRGDWQAFHALMLAWLIIASAATILAWVSLRWRKKKQLVTTSVQWATIFVGLSVLLALRATPFDPGTPWWPFATTLAAAGLAGALGFRTRCQGYAYASTLLSTVAVTIVWWGAWPNDMVQGVIEFVQLNLIAAVVVSIVWLFAEVRCQKRFGRSFDRFSKAPLVHHVVPIGASLVLLVFVSLGFGLTGLLDAARKDIDIANLTGWILLPLLGGLVIGSLWDQRMKLALPLLFAWGVITMLMSLDQVDQRFEFDSQSVFVAAGIMIAAYVALAGHLWKYGANLAAIGNRLGMPDTVRQLKRTRSWLPVVTLLLTAIILVAELAVVLAFRERWMRVGAAFAPLLLAYAVSCHAQQARRMTMQYASLILASLSAVFAVWADIEPGWRATFALERAVRLLMVVAGMAFLYAIPFSRWTKQRGGDWFPVVRRMAAVCGSAAIVALSAVLLLELAFFEPGIGAPFGHPYEVVAVVVVLVGLIIAFIAMALSPERDPLSLSEQGRMGYVYAAQVVGALLFAHIYLSNPQIFGAFAAYWPYIVMGIAFAGVGVGEIFQRSNLPNGGSRVLAEPLQRTGGFLPLLPALGWWLNQRLEIEAAGHYSLLLFFAGLFYLALSMLRRSYISGVAAAIAGNAALWALMADYEPFSLLKHPQFWLIPPACSMLVAAHLNRRRLNESQLTAIRYACLLVIYVSSTADIFIEGVGNSLWEPMVLATLSVIGVFIGIGLQIRAFLYLGVTFVFLSVVSMVWHAYANIQHVGIWWGFGILLGLLILTIFGVFEKKRPELLRMVEEMRRWEQ
ncbi:MAG: hypothetical protein H8E66_22265 [Planctomycetes bacterium]|nr:hypothetical protein [Planctomycetota bacterium]